jgi:magnesium-transporting ATPase (P-type)
MEELNSKYKEARGEEKERVEEELNGVMGELMRESLKNMAFSIVIFAPVLMYFNWQFKSPLTVSIFNKVFTLNWIWYYVFFSLVLSLLFSGFFSLYKRRKEMKEGDPK